MVRATKKELDAIGVTETPGIAVADTGYWNEEQIDNVVADEHVQVLIPPDAGSAPRPGRGGTAAGTQRCATCSRPTTPAGYTNDARRWSSQCSPRPNTTARSTASTDEDDPPSGPSGG